MLDRQGRCQDSFEMFSLPPYSPQEQANLKVLLETVSLAETQTFTRQTITTENDRFQQETLQCLLLPLASDPSSLVLICILRDIENALQEYREGITAVANHELRNPFMVLSMSINMMLAELPDGHSNRLDDAVQMIRENINRIISTFSKLLDYGELLTAFSTQEMKPLCLNTLIEAVIPPFKARHSAWSIHLPPQDIMVYGDEDTLTKALTAIVENAINYSSPSSLIRILLYGDEQNQQCFLKISDEGKGMDAAELEDAFTPFFHGEAIMNKHKPGLGLGLTLAKRILAQHGGKIYVDSSEGAGTSVTLKLPLNP